MNVKENKIEFSGKQTYKRTSLKRYICQSERDTVVTRYGLDQRTEYGTDLVQCSYKQAGNGPSRRHI